MLEIAIVGVLLILGVIVLIPIFQTVASIYPYSYPNARVRSLKSKLVTKNEFEELLTKPYNEIIYYLEKKHYSYLSKFLDLDFSFASLEGAIRSDLINTVGKLISISPTPVKEFLKVYAKRFDIQVIEALVRSLNRKFRISRDILSVTNTFSKDFIYRNNHSIEEIENELKQTGFRKFIDKHKDQIRNNKFADFEVDLDLFYYNKLIHVASSRNQKRLVKRLIDLRNVSLFIKDVKPNIVGGKISLDKLDDLNIDLLKVLKDHGYKIDNNCEVDKIERVLQLNLFKFANDLLKNEPLSDASILGFLLLKIINVRNLIILLKMKQHHIESSKIREVLAIW